ncbi:hypothetical protein [Caulobacter sp. S45]|uniref:hypothetical protein n=1 Tax=Caulobacter sp. S45 TaxID=1641861 RepID=UPI00131C4D82|nr:hypothetical protein [Caulobacter sp. S45]
MSDELALLAQAQRAYVKAPLKLRGFYERLIDSLTEMILDGRTLADPLPASNRSEE